MNAPLPKTQKARTALGDPIPVRFSNEIILRLDRIAPRLGGNRNTVIRLAVNRILPELEAGQLTLN